MRQTVIILAILLGLVTFAQAQTGAQATSGTFQVASVTGHTLRGDAMVQYEDCLAGIIKNCLLKAARIDSRSAAIRRCARLSREKAAYLSANRTQLITALAQQNIEPKPYKISRFINQQFFNTNPSLQ